jgi:hypothetical protein
MSVEELKSPARDHWETWLPAKVRDLRERGCLEEELHGAACLAQNQIDHLKQHLHYQEHEAREVALSQFILLTPEPGAGQPDWEREELAALEAEYQRNPPVPTEKEQEEWELERQRELEGLDELMRSSRKPDTPPA